ncbi:MAG: hypothetical protein ACOYYJ_15285 [Chloroflexota bacterium]
MSDGVIENDWGQIGQERDRHRGARQPGLRVESMTPQELYSQASRQQVEKSEQAIERRQVYRTRVKIALF